MKKVIKDFENGLIRNIEKEYVLSESFIEKYQDKLNWDDISQYQQLSESFIEKYKNKVNWFRISEYQRLSEPFIEKWQNILNWDYISMYQNLSEPFIEKYKDKVDWDIISKYQKLSQEFIKKYKDKLDVKTQLKTHHDKRTYKQKKEEAIKYCKEYNLKYFKNYFIAYRKHDQWGRGIYNKTICYKRGVYYRDWRCDLDPHEENSFGLGIFPKGNVKVKVLYKDWGVEVCGIDNDGKARVWGFEIL
jgi:hypothetical protein